MHARIAAEAILLYLSLPGCTEIGQAAGGRAEIGGLRIQHRRHLVRGVRIDAHRR